ncbi:MAG: O-antigen ligase family protein [Cyclobacteriaceae bacterium]|nr:O-antigen ligase family protein [Cyclobacteriaceae bacterium HetDA_MAG_MS6]
MGQTAIKFRIMDLMVLGTLLFITIYDYLIIGSSISFEIIVSSFGVLLIYLITRSIRDFNLAWPLIAIAIATTLEGLYGITQHLGYSQSSQKIFSVTGHFFNPAPYAGFLCIGCIVSIGLYVYRNKIHFPDEKLRKVFLVYLPALNIVVVSYVLPLTESRSSWLAILAGLLALSLCKYGYLVRSVERTKVLASVVILMALAIPFLIWLYKYKESSANGRWLIWVTSFEMIQEKPIQGHGSGAFLADYMEYQANFFEKNPESNLVSYADNISHPYNEFLLLVVSYGMLGLSLLLIGFAVIVKSVVIGRIKAVHLIALTVMVSISTFALFSYPSDVFLIKLFFMVCLAIISTAGPALVSLNSSRAGRIVLGLSLVSISIIVWIELNELYRSKQIWLKADSHFYKKELEESLGYYEMALKHHRTDAPFLTQYGKTLTIARKNEKALEILFSAEKMHNSTIVQICLGDVYKDMGEIEKAEEKYLLADQMVPFRLYPKYLLAKLYFNHDKLAFLRVADEILHMKAKVPSRAATEIKEKVLEMVRKKDTSSKRED